MKKIVKILMIILLIINSLLILNGCKTNEYKEFSRKFNSIYSEIINPLNTNDILGTLRDIQTEENKNKIEELRILLEDIDSKVPSEKKDEYERLVNNYKGLEILLTTPYSAWDKLSFDQQRIAWKEIGLINIIQN